MSLVASCKAFLKISLELHRVRIPWRARSASLQGGSGDGDLSGVQGAQPPVEGQVNKAPPPSEAECLFVLRVQMKLQMCPIIDISKSENHTENGLVTV